MEQFKGKRVFISGGNGVIGNALVRKLHESGAIIFVGDLKPRPATWSNQVIYRQGDLNLITKQELDAFSPELFFHLAATFERSVESYNFWSENFHHNVRLGHHLMTCLKDSSSLKKVIFASSYLIYEPSLYQFPNPQSDSYSLRETDPIYPRNLTGVAKLLHEIELRFINDFKRDNFKIVSARIFRGHGLGSKDIISRWVRSLIKGETLKVYRKEGKFDYIFSEDSAEGLLRLAITAEAEGVVNLGTGHSRSVSDVIQILTKHFPTLIFVEEDPGVDIPFESSQANIELLLKLTDWRPKYSLEESIGEIVSFETTIQNKKEPNALCAFNVLVTSIGAKVPLLKRVKEGMNKAGIVGKLFGGDVDSTCLGQYFIDEFWTMPRISPETLPVIIDYCVGNKIKAIVPTRDGELAFFATAKSELDKHGIRIMVSDEDTIMHTVDKLLFYQIGRDLGFPVIPTTQNIQELSCKAFVVKERFGAGGKSIGLNLNRELADAHGKKLNEPVFQPFVSGKEFSVDLYVGMNGKVKGVICRSREKVVNGESQITATVADPKLEHLCTSFAESLKFYGHILFQVIQDQEGYWHIIECNARFGGASSLSVAAGLDSFYWFLVEVCGAKLLEYAFTPSPTPMRQIRFASDVVESVS